MNGIRKLICKVFGHNAICLFSFHWDSFRTGSQGSMTTAWKCLRCDVTWIEQWDT